ncbi:unnamed protein product [Prorocentrum cordatum]|uniref:Uncharacterized protein n=1 Tax=Prorocentrum cordatum TaxID=2364126 RepID=A0ABN9TIY9_9DINO|nr:unnamed protein product [Polarella glacialis]
MTLLLRRHASGADKVRYKIMRRSHPQDVHFFVARAGAADRIRSMERCEILSRRPNGNGASFHILYCEAVRQTFTIFGTRGPLDIYSPRHSALLLQWSGSKSGTIDWKLLEKKWHVDSGPVALASRLHGVTGQGRKMVAARRVNWELRARGLPPLEGTVVYAPWPAALPAMRSAMCVAIRLRDIERPPSELTWLLSHVRIVARAPPKFRAQWNAPAVSKRLCADDLLNVDSRSLAHAADGIGMRRIDRVWDVTVRCSHEDMLASLRSHVARACTRLCLSASVRQQARSVACDRLATSRSFRLEQKQWHRSQSLYDQYTSDMHVRPDEALVPDDKFKKYMWLLPCIAYQWLILSFAISAPAWRLTCLDWASANDWCWSVLDELLTPSVKAFVCFHRYARVVPYMYGTVKSKCFRGGVRVCTRAGHSCLRKVVSFAAWPMRRRWRYIHRALETVMREYGGGDEVWSLREATQVMNARIQAARPTSVHRTCARCQRAKVASTAVVADAGQFFEAVRPRDAICAARTVLLRCQRATGKEAVTVLKNQRRVAFFGGAGGVHDGKKVCFSFTDLLLAFSACMFVTLCSLGDKIFHLSGLPIGGVLSKVAASFVLGLEENRWSLDVARRRSLGFAATNPAWDREVARGRYVDDLLWVSSVYCWACMCEAVHEMYSVPFEIARQSHVADWLDVQLDLASHAWRMAPKEVVLPPPWAASRGYARGLVLGRLHRWSEVGLVEAAWVEAAAHLMLRFRSAGWPMRVLRAEMAPLLGALLLACPVAVAAGKGGGGKGYASWGSSGSSGSGWGHGREWGSGQGYQSGLAHKVNELCEAVDKLTKDRKKKKKKRDPSSSTSSSSSSSEKKKKKKKGKKEKSGKKERKVPKSGVDEAERKELAEFRRQAEVQRIREEVLASAAFVPPTGGGGSQGGARRQAEAPLSPKTLRAVHAETRLMEPGGTVKQLVSKGADTWTAVQEELQAQALPDVKKLLGQIHPGGADAVPRTRHEAVKSNGTLAQVRPTTVIIVVVALFVGALAGMFMAGAAEPQWLPRPFARAWRYVSALKVVAWDEQYFSGWLEHVSGVPILSASSGALFVLFGYARREAPESGVFQ